MKLSRTITQSQNHTKLVDVCAKVQQMYIF